MSPARNPLVVALDLVLEARRRRDEAEMRYSEDNAEFERQKNLHAKITDELTTLHGEERDLGVSLALGGGDKETSAKRFEEIARRAAELKATERALREVTIPETLAAREASAAQVGLRRSELKEAEARHCGEQKYAADANWHRALELAWYDHIAPALAECERAYGAQNLPHLAAALPREFAALINASLDHYRSREPAHQIPEGAICINPVSPPPPARVHSEQVAFKTIRRMALGLPAIEEGGQ